MLTTGEVISGMATAVFAVWLFRHVLFKPAQNALECIYGAGTLIKLYLVKEFRVVHDELTEAAAGYSRALAIGFSFI